MRRNNRLCNVARHRLIVVEREGVDTASASHGSQIVAIAQHFGMWNKCCYHTATMLRVHSHHFPTPRCKVTDHIAHVFFGDKDTHTDNRLQQYRTPLHKGVLEGFTSRNLEGNIL